MWSLRVVAIATYLHILNKAASLRLALQIILISQMNVHWVREIDLAQNAYDDRFAADYGRKLFG
jgi:hypothetical protein